MSYEYTVIPAPARGEKSKNAKTGIERFANTLTDALNQMAADGWEYVRAETLPAEERSGLTSRTTVYHNMLVFRRALAQPEPARQQAPAAQPETRPEPAPAPAPTPQSAPDEPAAAAEPAARGPFTAPMRPNPKLAEEDHSGARMTEPPVSAPEEKPAPPGPRLGPANR